LLLFYKLVSFIKTLKIINTGSQIELNGYIQNTGMTKNEINQKCALLLHLFTSNFIQVKKIIQSIGFT